MGDDLQDPGLSLNDHEARNRADWNANAGDWVAAPGLLSEVSWASAVEASQLALEAHVRPKLRRVA